MALVCAMGRVGFHQALQQFLTLQSPLMVKDADGERRVVLAFAVTVEGELLTMGVGLGGGPLLWEIADLLDWPAPIGVAPGGPGQQVRATLDHLPPKGRQS